MSDSDTNEPNQFEAHWDTSKSSGSEMWEQKRRLAEAMRLVIERLGPSNAPTDELRTAAEALERYAEALREHPRLEKVMGHSETANAGNVGAFFDQSPLIGLANPLAPPIVVSQTGEKTAGAQVTFGSAYEGPPGSVHGGVIALVFDELLGCVNVVNELGGFTGTLTIRYRALTPVGRPIRMRSWIDRQEGRKTWTQGTMHDGDTLCAEAEGVFIRPRPEDFVAGLAEPASGC